MSINTRASSRNTQNQTPRQNFFQPTGPRNSISEELINLESGHNERESHSGNPQNEIVYFQEQNSEN